MQHGTALELPTDKILARKGDGIGWLTFNQPERRNAISLAMWDAVALAAEDFARDPEVRVVVMSGAGGKAFASGADISEFEKARADADAEREYARHSSRARELLAGLEVPLIAMIQGYCIGGGMATALQADLRIASSDSRFGIPAARLGVSYGYTALERLTALAGPALAKEVMFLGRHYTAAQALTMRLVNQVVEPDQLLATVEGIAGEIVQNAPLSIRASKIAIDQIAGDPARRDAALVEAANRACFDSADYREGRRAFMEKRTPRFQGR
ncbi:MAG TPA: enoyl-CoA hydratase [Geminicoccaceae bacterium]